MRQKIVVVLLFGLMLVVLFERSDWVFRRDHEAVIAETQLEQLFEQRISDVQVAGSGAVQRLLEDDTRGTRHQRFIVELPGGHTVLISHNIDLAPRLDNLAVGDTVEFYGEYEWNERGGVVHWTHHDPKGSHTDGWLRHKGRTYR